MKWKWLVVPALLPLALGLALAVLIASGQVENKILYMRADMGTVALLGGLLLSGPATVFLLRELQVQRRRQRDAARVHAQAAEERRRFLRRLDHELKNPLTAIRAGLANLSWVSTTEERQKALDSVQAQTVRLSRLAADLRKLAELETRPLELSPVKVADVLQEVLDVAQERPEASGRRLTLTVPQAPWPLPAVNGDRDLLFLAVHNLVDNALKFTGAGDTVEIRAFEDGASVVVEVADTGPGIPEAEIYHVWEELYRGQSARGIPGSGLGLALVHAIAERHGGQVGLRSRQGQGTVFTLQLPVR